LKGNVALMAKAPKPETSKESIEELSSEEFLIDLIRRGFKVQEIILSEYESQDLFEVKLIKKNVKPVDWIRRMVVKVNGNG